MQQEILGLQLCRVGVVVSRKKIFVQISREDSKIALCFKDFFLVRKIIAILKKKFNAKSTLKNYLMFYLPLFDDYLKVYKIEGKSYIFEPDGFSYSDGFAFWTELENEKKFLEILDVLKEKLDLVIEINTSGEFSDNE